MWVDADFLLCNVTGIYPPTVFKDQNIQLYWIKVQGTSCWTVIILVEWFTGIFSR